MRSIRWSFLLCILVLLVLSLATVSFLAYHEAEASLIDKKDSMRQFLKAKHAEQREKAEKRLEQSLLDDANTIVRNVRLQFEWPPPNSPSLLALGALGTVLIPDGHFFAPLPLAQGASVATKEGSYVPGPLRAYFEKKVPWILVPTLKLSEVGIPPERENDSSKFYQINTVLGDEWRSHSMADYSFPFDPATFASPDTDAKGPLVAWSFHDVKMKSGIQVRLVKAKFGRVSVSWSNPWVKGGQKGKAPAQPAEKKPALPAATPPSMSVFIQVAAARDILERELYQYEAERDQGLAQLEEDSENSLATLRDRLLLLAGITLLGAVFLGCLIVGWGLTPLRRLSDAVSKVSEKDFHLNIEGKSLPAELRPIADRLAQTLDQLKRAFAREKQAAADISHELRTPLAAMLTTIDVALRKPRPVGEYQEILEECRIAAVQISQLVERMLALARLDAGVDHLRPSQVDVVRLADQCSALVRPLAEARGVSVSVDHNGPACIHADPDKLREVLTNLLHNAIEYNKPEGTINVSVHRDNGSLEMQVRDTGIGISPQAQEHIFERFFREDPSRQAEGLHAGIGLALVKGYVDLMGGQIRVNSIVGEGSTFTIRLPAGEEAHS